MYDRFTLLISFIAVAAASSLMATIIAMVLLGK